MWGNNYVQCTTTESDFTLEKLCDKAEEDPVTRKEAQCALQCYRNAKTDTLKEEIAAYEVQQRLRYKMAAKVLNVTVEKLSDELDQKDMKIEQVTLENQGLKIENEKFKERFGPLDPRELEEHIRLTNQPLARPAYSNRKKIVDLINEAYSEVQQQPE